MWKYPTNLVRPGLFNFFMSVSVFCRDFAEMAISFEEEPGILNFETLCSRLGSRFQIPPKLDYFFMTRTAKKNFTDPNRALDQVLERLLANLISNFKIVQGLESLKRTHGKTALDYNNLPKFKFINF